MEGGRSSFRDLVVWQKSRELAKLCYQLSSGLPKAEQFGLVAQIRSAAISIPANISEGAGRGSKKEFVQFLRIARGSLYEIETYLVLIVDLGFVETHDIALIEDVRRSVDRLLAALIKSQL